MKNKIIIISLFIIISSAIYLFMTHHYIYERLSDAGLKSPDLRGEYMIGRSENNGTKLIYAALGDSLTAGVGVSNYEDSFPYQFAKKMSGNSNNQIILRNRAYPGARTGHLIKDLLPSAINDRPDVVTLLIGVNDIHGNVSKKVFSENYAEILRRLKTKTKATIIAISIPFIGTDSLLFPPYDLYFKYETIEYNKIIKKLAQESNVKYVDLFTPTERMFENSAFYSADLFHPSARGYELWSDIIYAGYDK